MNFKLTFDPRRLGSYLPAFVSLVGEERWRKRAVQLSEYANKSPWAAKVITDYHWLEIALSALLIEIEIIDTLATEVSARTLGAMRFAATVVEAHKRLSASGRTAKVACVMR